MHHLFQSMKSPHDSVTFIGAAGADGAEDEVEGDNPETGSMGDWGALGRRCDVGVVDAELEVA